MRALGSQVPTRAVIRSQVRFDRWRHRLRVLYQSRATCVRKASMTSPYIGISHGPLQGPGLGLEGDETRIAW